MSAKAVGRLARIVAGIRLRRVISECEMIPAWYGIAYRNFSTYRAVCYPIPLNKLVGWAMALRNWAKDCPYMRCGGCLRKTMVTITED